MSIYLFGKWNPELISLLMRLDKDPILQNANRLLADADFLFKHKRYATALALSVISFEEIGKFLLKAWSDADPSFSYDTTQKHVMKQAAVACLFATVEIVNNYRNSRVDFAKFNHDEHLKLHDAIRDGLDKWRPFTADIVKKVYENLKWSGLYYDTEKAAKGIEPNTVTIEKAGEMIAMTFKAFTSLREEGIEHVAKNAFDGLVNSDIPQFKHLANADHKSA